MIIASDTVAIVNFWKLTHLPFRVNLNYAPYFTANMTLGVIKWNPLAKNITNAVKMNIIALFSIPF